MLKKLAYKFDIDFDIGNTLLLRGWSILSGGLLVLFIPIFLSVSEQGYYFTFSSLIGMQVFFELGFNFVVIQLISHEMVSVKITNGKLYGKEYSVNRIYCLISMLVKWYAIISILFFLIVFFLGYYFFHTNGSLAIHNWIYSWFFVVLFSAVNIFVSPFLAVLEGMGLVGNVARIRLYQSVLGYVFLATLFLFDFKLNAIPAISGTAALFSVIYLLRFHFKILFERISNKKNYANNVAISWRREIFPFQWRIAVSWLSGYFIFQLFNPLIFSYQGATEAGRLGLTLTIFSTILTLSMSWVNAKIPTISRLISKKEGVKVNILFKKLFFRSLCFNIFLSVFTIIIIKVMILMKYDIIYRIVDFNAVIIISFVTIVNHIIFCLASYMRAHKTEPLLFNSIATGGLVSVFAYMTSKISVTATVFSYMMILAFITLPWVYWLFRRFYKLNSCKVID